MNTSANAIPLQTAKPAFPAELVAHHLLKLVGTFPGHMGRMRAARIIGGYAVPYRNEEEVELFAPFVVAGVHEPLRVLVTLVDALIRGGLLAQTVGPRPVLVLTVAGFRALDALEQPA